MKVTERDTVLVRDIALSGLLTRDQILALGYFASVSRANRRLKQLTDECLLKALTLSSNGQRLYVAGSKAEQIVGERIYLLLRGRHETPRFLHHAEAVTDVRIALLRQGFTGWRFEAQIRDSVHIGDTIYEIRPDGLISGTQGSMLIEVDLGNVSRKSFAKKMKGYEMYAKSGRQHETFKVDVLRLLVVTTGTLRLAHLKEICRPATNLATSFLTFTDLGIEKPGGWS